MEEDTRQIEDILDGLLKKLNLIDATEVPGIDLYMDQVTTFMESHLGNLKRNPEDKVLTKTMINNYAKNELLPSPEKKRYTKNHVLLLTFIYYFKNVLSINDIKTLLGDITKNHFNRTDGLTLEQIYREIVKNQPEVVAMVKEDLREKEKLTETLFEGEADEALLKNFSLLCFLGFDMYLKKVLMEAVIDDLFHEKKQEAEKKPEKKTEKKPRKD